MSILYRRFSVIAGFILLLAVLLVNAAITRSEVEAQIRSHYWVSHTQKVLLELSLTQSLLQDAETGRRGFLYTGNEQYLEPSDFAAGKINSHLDELASLTADNATQQVRIAQLRDLCQKKLAEVAQTIALFRAGHPDQAKAVVLTNSGMRTMDQIRGILTQMREEEVSLEEKRLTDYDASTRRTIRSIYLATLVAAIGLVLLGFYILREMSLRERHASQIRQREEWFRVTLTSVGDGVIATDREGNVSFLNSVAEQLTGVSPAEAKGKSIATVFPIFNEQTQLAVENPVRKVLEQGAIVGLANHTVLKHKDGRLIPIEDSAAPIRDDRNQLVGVVLVFRDATHERKSQEILRKTEKLAAAARLSATMAHEINNPLEAVVNLIFIAKSTPGVPSEAQNSLTGAERELERVSHITRQTLGFYRESSAAQAVEIPELVDSVLRLYGNKLTSKGITLERDFATCPPVFGMQGELQQMVSNLISNAADAAGHNGKVRVVVSPVEQSGHAAVELKVEDDGPGIVATDLDRIFEPFFTTKKDVGTGLGLWVAKQIAERHDGNIHVRTFSGDGLHGAVFTVILPCAEQVLSAEAV